MKICWTGKGKNKEKELKSMVVEIGKTCSRSKEKYNFNRAVEK
jgi:hypothetical protein